MESTAPASSEVSEALEKVLSSTTFRSSGRSSKLLRYLVEETLKGNAERLKDYTLGAEALGRGDDFDPRTDPIARVEASRLRSRLELYYATEGATDTIQIALPKGSYVPTFVNRPAKTAIATPPPSRRREHVLIAALVLVTLVAVLEGLWLRRSASGNEDSSERRLEITTPPTTDPASLAVSPDGDKIVFVATSRGNSQLWLRQLDSTEAKPLAGTDNAASPFWSPDSRSLGFFADGKLKRIDIDGGSVQFVARALVSAGAAWNADGFILFPLVPDSPIFKVPVKGGEPTPVTRFEPGHTGHRAPQFLPDGRRFLFYVMGSPDVRGIYVGDLAGGAPRRLLDSDSPAVYSPSGHVMFVHQGRLFSQKLDLARLELVGDPLLIAEGLIFGARAGIPALSVSAAGPIAYRVGSSGERRQLIWFDRFGKEIAKIGSPDSYGPGNMSLSKDNRRLAVQRSVDGNTDIWLLDLSSGGAVRFTSEPEPQIAPIWSPAGDRVVFSSRPTGVFDLHQKQVTAAAADTLLATAQHKQATDWSSDGRLLLFRSIDPKTDWDIWAMPLDEGAKPFPVVQTNFEERDGQFSPDGKWMAYQSNESGRFEVYVQPFPGPGEKHRVSSNGGAHARWSRDGKELFYIALDGHLISVPIRFSSDDRAVESAVPVPLFFARIGPVQDTSRPYAVASDGQRFLIDTVVEEAAPPITIILNWKPPLK